MLIRPLLAIVDLPIIAAVVVLGIALFGINKLPKFARNIGLARKEFLLSQLADERQPPDSGVPPTRSTRSSGPDE